MHRFFVPRESTPNAEIDLPPAEANHATRVLRLKAPDRVEVLNGAGETILCEFLGTDRGNARLRVLQRDQTAPPPAAITLYQAIPKPRAMDLIVQKATELGAASIVPILSDRTVSQWNDSESSGRVAKWKLATIEAAKQCGSPWLPTIEPPRRVPAALQNLPPVELALLASLQPGARHPRHIFDELRKPDRVNPASVAVWVGPEGDFTPAELNSIRSSGALPITLGPLVLRSETAAIYCLSILAYETRWQTDPIAQG